MDWNEYRGLMGQNVVVEYGDEDTVLLGAITGVEFKYNGGVTFYVSYILDGVKTLIPMAYDELEFLHTEENE